MRKTRSPLFLNRLRVFFLPRDQILTQFFSPLILFIIVLEKLFEMYSKTEKQVFIAMDKEMSYTERAQEILNDSVVLRLSPDGNELFGRSWNKKTKEDK